MTQTINGYDAILVKGTPRFRYNRKMIAGADVPTEIREALVQAIVDEKLASEAVPAKPIEVNHIETTEVSSEVIPDYASVAMPSQYEMELISELEAAKAAIAELELEAAEPRVGSPLLGLAAELHQRYGIYITMLGVPPTSGDIHPFTGKIMNRYEMGLAYQAFKGAKARGALNRDYEETVERARDGEVARETHQEEFEQRRTGQYDDGYKTFAERTAPQFSAAKSTVTVNRKNDPISEDITPEPNVHRQTIRKNW